MANRPAAKCISQRVIVKCNWTYLGLRSTYLPPFKSRTLTNNKPLTMDTDEIPSRKSVTENLNFFSLAINKLSQHIQPVIQVKDQCLRRCLRNDLRRQVDLTAQVDSHRSIVAHAAILVNVLISALGPIRRHGQGQSGTMRPGKGRIEHLDD